MPSPQTVQAVFVDEFGELARKIAALAPDVARHKALAALFQSYYDDSPAEEAFTLEGSRYTLQISPRHSERAITSMGKLFTFLGRQRFLKFCKFPLKDLDANVTAADQEAFTESTATGSRSVKAVPRAGPTVEVTAKRVR